MQSIQVMFATFFSLSFANTQMSTMSNEEVFVCFEGKVRTEQAELGGRFYEQMAELVKTQPGFISQTPFFSVNQDLGQVLYVKFDNEEQLHSWKNNYAHLEIQAKGRADVFVDYRLRIGNEAFPGRSRASDKDTASVGKYLLVWQYLTQSNNSSPASNTCLPDNVPFNVEPFIWQHLVDANTYEGVDDTLRISAWPTKEMGLTVKAGVPRVPGDELRLIRIERDYGRFQRQEAPDDADRCQQAAVNNDTEALGRC